MWQIKMRNKRIFRRPIWRPTAIVMASLLSMLGYLTTESGAQVKTVSVMSSPEQEKERRKELERIVFARLEYYARHYPDIDFVILDSRVNVSNNMQILAQVLGEEPTPLDYEHPEDLRESLLTATLMRIELLLPTDSGSATFFKPGKNALAQRKYVCVVTIHPWAIAKDDRSATRHLLEVPDEMFDEVSPVNYLDHKSHLKFGLDHEIFHCLDTLYNGSVKMSQRKHWSEYHMIKDESGADAFGIIMNIAAQGTVSPYARMLKNIRGLTLLGDDPNHYTYPAIGAVLQMDPVKLSQLNIQERFKLARKISNQVVGNYDDYIRYITAAYYVTEQLGKKSDMKVQGLTNVDHDMVKRLLMDTHRAYRDLTGQELPPAR